MSRGAEGEQEPGLTLESGLFRRASHELTAISSVNHVDKMALPSSLRVRCPSTWIEPCTCCRIDQHVRGIAASRITKFYDMNSLFFMLSSTSPVPRLSLTLPPPSSLVRWSLFKAYPFRPLVNEDCTATGQAPSQLPGFLIWRLGKNRRRTGPPPP